MTTTENNVAAQAGDEPLTERDIADLRNVIAVAERGRMPDLAAQAQAMLDSGVLPARAAGKTVQAGDEPMLRDAVAAKIAEFYPQSTPFDMEKNQRLAGAILRLPMQRNAAAQVSPRATADVERDAARYRWLRDKADSTMDRAPMVFNVEACEDIGWLDSLHGERLDAVMDVFIATTKPGA